LTTKASKQAPGTGSDLLLQAPSTQVMGAPPGRERISAGDVRCRFHVGGRGVVDLNAI